MNPLTTNSKQNPKKHTQEEKRVQSQQKQGEDLAE